MSVGQDRGICLVLGGGAFRGFAHLGVLRGLQRLAVRIDSIVGVSIGGLVAAFHAGLGYSPGDLEHSLSGLTTSSLFHLGWCLYGGRDPDSPEPRDGTFEATLRELRRLDLDRLHFGIRRLGLLALDLFTGEEVFVASGVSSPIPAAEIAVAGASIPGLFPWVRWEHEGRTYRLVDGGFSRAVPVERALEPPFSAGRIVAVDLQVFRGARERNPRRWEDLERRHPGRVLRLLPRVDGIGTVFFRPSHAQDLIRAGEAAVLEQARALC